MEGMSQATDQQFLPKHRLVVAQILEVVILPLYTLNVDQAVTGSGKSLRVIIDLDSISSEPMQ